MREVGDEDPKRSGTPGRTRDWMRGKDRSPCWSLKAAGPLVGGETGKDLLSWGHPFVHLFNNF